jgi:hypothetical protein
MNDSLVETIIKNKLEEISSIDSDYWSFRKKADREHVHAYFQYPAMMVPRLQGELIKVIIEADSHIKRVFDPFVGSGTVLTESMIQGLSFTGQDINPLAILICKIKEGPFVKTELVQKVNKLIQRIDCDKRNSISIKFSGLDKWFRKDIQFDLSRLKRAIRFEKSLWARRFFWVALAETVRLTSNSRISTFKLHIRPESELKRDINAIETYKQILLGNLERFAAIEKLLEEKKLIDDGYYVGETNIFLADTLKTQHTKIKKHNLLVTSPPYGDNHSTVPYGQHSYLPLQWIDLKDIDEKPIEGFIENTHSIDSKSLGGSRKDALKDLDELRSISPTFDRVLYDLDAEPPDRKSRVATFCKDLNNSIDPILSNLEDHSFLIFTVGNRKVANKTVAIDKILEELLVSRNVKTITKLKRRILSKRMALKNNFAKTMATETILIMRLQTNEK